MYHLQDLKTINKNDLNHGKIENSPDEKDISDQEINEVFIHF